jgi:thioredoxin 1
MAGTLQVTDTDFTQEIEQHDGLAMVDFWAVWCGPCQMVAPSVEQIASEYAGRVKVAKLDVDQSPKTPMRFRVRSIPSILFFKKGQLVDTVVGAVPKSQLTAKIEQHLR